MAADATLGVGGTVSRRITGAAGSVLQATGTTAIGVLSATDGYAFGGKLEVGSNVVGLNDANLAAVAKGVTIAGGTLSSFNGILLAQGSAFRPGMRVMTGDGTVNGYVYLNQSRGCRRHHVHRGGREVAQRRLDRWWCDLHRREPVQFDDSGFWLDPRRRLVAVGGHGYRLQYEFRRHRLPVGNHGQYRQCCTAHGRRQPVVRRIRAVMTYGASTPWTVRWIPLSGELVVNLADPSFDPNGHEYRFFESVAIPDWGPEAASSRAGSPR